MSSQNRPSSIANMEGLQSAVVAGEITRVKELLKGRVLDDLQKHYLIDLAELNNRQDIIQAINQAPSR